MKLISAALKSPAAVAVTVALILLVGVISLFKLPVQLFPDIERPRIAIQTQWRAASPKEVESEILEPQEQVLKGIPGLRSMNAFANQGGGFINLVFGVETDMEQTLIEVISRMTRVQNQPRDALPPRIMLGGFGGNNPALTWFFLQALPGNDKSISDYIDFTDDVIRPRLESINGVAGVQTFSDQNREELQIRFDPIKVAQYGIQIPQLISLVSASNDISGGFIDVGRRQYTLRFNGKYKVDELSDLILESRNFSNIRLGDVAKISVSRQDRQQLAIQNGNPAFSFRIDKANGANVLETLNRVKDEVALINEEVLADKQLVMVQSFDASVFIYRAINLVTSNLFAGVILSLAVLWLFIRRMRATLIIATAIPISLFSTFIVLQITGRSLNVISLAGLAFAVGMVLDAAIVVLENILRMREQGHDNHKSSELGSKQVWGALLASTATTVAIFLPVFFLKDIEGQLFGDLALTIAIAVSVSLLVAAVLLPVLTKYFLHDRSIVDPNQGLWNKITSLVMSITNSSIKRLVLSTTLLALPVAITYMAMPKLDYLPPVKRDAVDANLRFPPGTNVKTLEKEVVNPIVERLKPYMDGTKEPALKNYYIFSGPFGGNLGIRAKDQSKVNELLDVVKNEILVDLPDTSAFARQGNLFGGFGGGRSVQMHLQSKDSNALQQVAKQTLEWVKDAIPDVSARANPGLEMAEPEIRLTPNDRNILEQGWDRRDVGRVVRTLGDGLYVGEYFNGTKRLNMILRADGWSDPDSLGEVPIVTGNGAINQLSELVTIDRTAGPSRLTRIDGNRTISININPPQGWSLEETIAVLKEQVAPKIAQVMPADGNIIYGGSADQLEKAIGIMSENFAFALVILFLLMAALFRSVKDSALVVITIPLATVGGILALQILNLFVFQPLDLLTMIGFVILLGLVVNNAILLVHQTRLAQKNGLNRESAIEQALTLRLRPIFMSTATSFFGMLPLLLVPGAGSVIYRGLAGVIVGGLAVSTIFTIVLLPCLLRLSAKDFGFKKSLKNDSSLVPVANVAAEK
ncbi:efflux RND transporter permease subunit [Pseudoalteromonas sp. C2R02]|uniref:efflux RND transporter permease subunit n=1 Tax=Pseudoalteromonas sp. C2R02 TaxID=2841565 RepID=UPI001C09299B|nr:efflux RND transporter permease subunit [Pseudoalteromonas sp. C2R02]MBU2968690.1 efflux RND transporter permease subunit [Pseudoalteromonas sp. C2R02]